MGCTALSTFSRSAGDRTGGAGRFFLNPPDGPLFQNELPDAAPAVIGVHPIDDSGREMLEFETRSTRITRVAGSGRASGSAWGLLRFHSILSGWVKAASRSPTMSGQAKMISDVAKPCAAKLGLRQTSRNPQGGGQEASVVSC